MSISKEMWAAVFFAFAMLWACEAVGDEQKKDEIEELKAMWKSQQSEIATAHIRYRLFQDGGPDVLPLGPDQVRKIVASKDLAANPDDLRIIVNKLLQKPHPSPTPWSTFDFYYEGAKSKDAQRGSLNEVLLQTDKERVEYSPVNSQAAIFTAGGSRRHMRSMEEFRTVPNTEISYDIDERKGSLWTLKAASERSAASIRLSVDPSTGALLDGDYYSNGKIMNQVVQRSFVSYPGGIVFPSLSAVVTYHQSGMCGISLSWVEEAEFNKELPKGTFSVPIPGKTNVFDNRNPSHIRTFPETGPAEDVVKMADVPRPFEMDRPNQVSWWIFGNILLLALLIGVILWRKVRLRHS